MQTTTSDWLTDDGQNAQTVTVKADDGATLLSLDRYPDDHLWIHDHESGRVIVPRDALEEALRMLEGV